MIINLIFLGLVVVLAALAGVLSYLDDRKRKLDVPFDVSLEHWLSQKRQWQPFGHFFLHMTIGLFAGALLSQFVSVHYAAILGTIPSFLLVLYQEYVSDKHPINPFKDPEVKDLLYDLATRGSGWLASVFYLEAVL